jgi:hypothetical protein
MRSDPNLTGFHTRNKPRTYPLHQARSDRMPCKSSVALLLLVVSLVAPAIAFAQVPQAGAAGAGSSAISGIPFGPANPSALSDPSGIGNASRMPPLGTNSPAPPVTYGPIGSPSPRRDALCGRGRVTADHRAGSSEIEKVSSSRPGRGQYLHGNLPGVLAR